MLSNLKARAQILWEEKPQNLLLALFLIAYPLVVVPLPCRLYGPWPDYFYLPRLVLLGLLALLGALCLAWEGVQPRRPYIMLLLAFYLTLALSASLADHPLTAWLGAPLRYTGVLTYLLCGVLFLLALKTPAGAWERLFPFWTIGASLASLLAVLQAGGINLVPHEPFRRGMVAFGTLGNPSYLGGYLALSLMPALGTCCRHRKAWAYISLALVFLGLLVSLDWGAWMGAGAGIFVYLALARKEPSLSLDKKCSLPLAGASILFLLLFRLRRLNKLIGMVAFQEYWQFLTEGFKLFTGVGPLGWAVGLGPDHLVHLKKMMPWAPFLDKTPNMYLETALTAGLLGLISYLAFIASVLVCSKRSWVEKKELVSLAGAYLIWGLFSFENIILLPLFWISLGLLAQEEEGK